MRSSNPLPDATWVALCTLAAASLLSACGRNEPTPVSPNPGAGTPAPPTDPNDPLQRRKDPNSVPPASGTGTTR